MIIEFLHLKSFFFFIADQISKFLETAASGRKLRSIACKGQSPLVYKIETTVFKYVNVQSD